MQLHMTCSSSLAACDGQDRVHHSQCLVEVFVWLEDCTFLEERFWKNKVQCEINPIQRILVTVRVF